MYCCQCFEEGICRCKEFAIDTVGEMTLCCSIDAFVAIRPLGARG
jgi:hypothetical protein